MSRYVSYVSHQVMDDLFELGPDVWTVFQQKLDALEAEPYKSSTMVPADRSNDTGWTSRVARIRAQIKIDGKLYGAVVHYKVGPTQIKVHGFALHLVETQEES
jgi:hypothetical protein